MSNNSFGKSFVITTFGESHGVGIGVVIDGCPAGLKITREEIQKFVDLRRPGYSSVSTSRKEQDYVNILSGIFEGYTTGAPVTLFAKNEDVRSEDYEIYRRVPRPGHADYPALKKFGSFNDWRGGGRFSGRITLSFVMAGAIAKKLLESILNINVMAYTKQIGDVSINEVSIQEIKTNRYSNDIRCPDIKIAKLMQEEIKKAQKAKDSIGGIIECIVTGVPIGLGEPIFSSVESEISHAMFSIPGVKGIEFGLGFGMAHKLGSEVNDEYIFEGDKVRTKTNNSGGIQGGLTTGMPVVFRIVIRPTSSIGKTQRSVDLKTKKEANLKIKGRHDPCIVPRAVVVVEALTAIIFADLAIQGGFIPNVLGEKRDG